MFYVPAPLPAHPLRTLHRDPDEEVRFKGLCLEATPETSPPNLDSSLIREYEVTEEEFEAYSNLIDRLSTCVHRMGGHADEIQGDLGLRAQFVSKGIYCGGSEGYEEGCKRGLDAGAADWLLLLQVDSEERAGMMWGDGGRIYFMIHKDALQRQDFQGVHLILQCT